MFHGANAADEISPPGSLEAARSSARITPYGTKRHLHHNPRRHGLTSCDGARLSEEPIHASVGAFPRSQSGFVMRNDSKTVREVGDVVRQHFHEAKKAS